MKDWTESEGCTSRACCVICRDREGGRAWREVRQKFFALPGGEVDFDCPNGQPWTDHAARPDRSDASDASDVSACRAAADQRLAGKADKRGCGSCKERMIQKMKQMEAGTVVGDKAVSDKEQQQQAPSPAAATPSVGAGLKPAPTMRLAAVITAFNEGGEVRATADSILASMRVAQPPSAGESQARAPVPQCLVIVVDDGSTDGSGESCQGIEDVQVVRHEQPLGVGRSRNAGLDAALAWGADVVSFHDGHMRFPPGVLEALARKALEPVGPISPIGPITCSKAKGWWYDADHPKVKAGERKAGQDHEFVAWGADMHWNHRDGLQAKYIIYKRDVAAAAQPSPLPLAQSSSFIPQPSSFFRVPCPMGACYVFSRATIERLRSVTGRLWDDVVGRWGFSEQALAVKAFLLDVPILVSRDLQTHHKYRSANPVPGAGMECGKNACFSLAALLSPETFDLRFREYCDRYIGAENVKQLVQKAREGVRLPWTPAEEARIFTHLCGRGATMTDLHPDHVWVRDLMDEMDRMDPGRRSVSVVPQASSLPSVASAKEGHKPQALRVLQWRPGESTLLIKHMAPSAEIKCLEWLPHRVANWGPILRRFAPGVRLLQIRLEDWSNPDRSGHVQPGERFDLITIGGEFPDECRAAAERLLAPGGRILVNPTADRHQIEDAERKKCEEQIKAFTAKTPRTNEKAGGGNTQSGKAGMEKGQDGKAPAVSVVPPSHSVSLPLSVSSVKSAVTVVLLNWRRPENIGRILDALAAQTVKPRVILWDNGAGEGAPVVWQDKGIGVPMERHPLIARVVRPSENMGCFPRWWMAAMAETEYVAVLDDDLMPADPRVLEDAIHAQRDACPDGIVGQFGWIRVPGKDYRNGRHINGAMLDTHVDVIKGRFMLLRRELLARVPLVPAALRTSDKSDRADGSDRIVPSLSTQDSALSTSSLFRCDDIFVSLCVSGGRPGAHLVPACLRARWVEFHQDERALASQPGHYQARDEAVRMMLDGSNQPAAGSQQPAADNRQQTENANEFFAVVGLAAAAERSVVAVPQASSPKPQA